MADGVAVFASNDFIAILDAGGAIQFLNAGGRSLVGRNRGPEMTEWPGTCFSLKTKPLWRTRSGLPKADHDGTERSGCGTD